MTEDKTLNDKNQKNIESEVYNNQILQEIGQVYNKYTTKSLYDKSQLIALSEASQFPLANQRKILEGLYTDGIIKRIVDVPVNDAFKQGVIIKGNDMIDDKDIEKLSKIVHTNIVPQVAQALKWARLFGGAAIIITGSESAELDLGDENAKNLSQEEIDILTNKQPFDAKKLEQGSFFKVDAFSLWELNMVGTFTNPDYSREKIYNHYIKNSQYSVMGNTIHQSRIIALKGDQAPPDIERTLKGWGLSVIDSIVVPLQTYIKYTKGIFEFLDEAKVSHISIPNMEEAVQTKEGRENLKKHASNIAYTKNFLNLLVSDSKGGFEQKQLNFNWLPEVQNSLETLLSSAAGIPKNKLFGDSASGFASGRDSLENYYTLVQSVQEGILPILERLIKMKAKSLFGDLGTNFELKVSFPSLYVASDEEKQLMQDSTFNKLMQLYDRGILSASDIKQQINTGDMLPTQLSTEENEENFPEPNYQVSDEDK